MPTVTIEKRKRGFFGWLFVLLFWGWNLLMGGSLLAGMNNVAPTLKSAATPFERNATAAGATLGMGVLMTFWLIGALLFGLMVVFTRGPKTLITTET